MKAKKDNRYNSKEQSLEGDHILQMYPYSACLEEKNLEIYNNTNNVSIPTITSTLETREPCQN